MNSCVDDIYDVVNTNVSIMIENKKGKQVSFTNLLLLQTIANLRNQGPSSSQMQNMNHVHVNEEVVENVIAISSLRSGKDLLDSYKDHPFHKGSIDEETLNIMIEHNRSSEDEDESTKAEQNPSTYKVACTLTSRIRLPWSQGK